VPAILRCAAVGDICHDMITLILQGLSHIFSLSSV